MNRTAQTRRAQRGFTLIEVLVAVLVFSLGLLGMIALQARLLQLSTQNTDRARASQLADELAATMWQQQTVHVDAATLQAWQGRVAAAGASGLPNGSGALSYSSDGATALISVTWTPTTAKTGDASRQYSTTVVLP